MLLIKIYWSCVTEKFEMKFGTLIEFYQEKIIKFQSFYCYDSGFQHKKLKENFRYYRSKLLHKGQSSLELQNCKMQNSI